MLWTYFTGTICLIFVVIIIQTAAEIWEKDFTSEIEIGLSTTGYRTVDLKCGFDAFFVNVTVDSNFDGVLYTRGDFLSKKKPCFYEHKDVSSKRGEIAVYTLKIPFKTCHTLEDVSEQQYVNTLVLQHDSELIMPGDAAFRLICAFTPEIQLHTNIAAGPGSKIVLVDADPASSKFSEEHQVFSDSDTVSFPKRTQAKKDEL